MLAQCYLTSFLSLLLGVLPVHAETKSFGDFSGGLNTHISSLLIPENQSPNLQNILLDETGGITKRQGFSKLNSTFIGDGDDDVNAVYQLEQSDGDKFCVAFSSTNGYSSTDGCATFTSFVSSLTRNNDVNCEPYGDSLFCVNDQYNFEYDGTNDIPVPDMPSDLEFITVLRDRCFAAGTDATPSRLFWSNTGTCRIWDTSVDFVDIDSQDGDIITGLSKPLHNFLIIYKKFSTHLLQFNNSNTSKRKIITVSKEIGAINHRAIENFQNKQYFASVGSNGGQPGVFVTDGINIKEDTWNLRNDLDLADTFRAATGRQTIDTKSDWDAGAFDPFSMSSSRDSGFMQSSFTSHIDTIGTDWNNGTLVNVSTNDISGAIVLSSSVVEDAWGDGDFTTNPTWTTGGNDFWSINSNALLYDAGFDNNDNTGHIFTSNNFSTGSFIVEATIDSNASDDTSIDLIFATDGSDPSSLSGYFVRLTVRGTAAQSIFRLDSGSAVLLSSVSISAQGLDTVVSYTLEAQRNNAGDISFLVDGSVVLNANDTTHNTDSTHFIFRAITGIASGGLRHATISLDDFFAYRYSATGDIISQIFDTVITTPTWSIFDVSSSSNSQEVITFEVQASTDSDDTFENLVSQTPGVEIQAKADRFIRYKASFTTSIASKSARLDSINISAASTGTWTSAELFLSNDITTFGLFQTTEETEGSEASITYTIKTATTQGEAQFGPEVSISPGVAITASTGAYIILKGTWTVGVATETAKTQTIIINWKEGAQAKSSTMKVFKGRLHWCSQSEGGNSNDVCYVKDSRGAWVKWTGVTARHLNVVNQQFVMGGSTVTTPGASMGFIYKLYDTDADDGEAIDAFWESKDFSPQDKLQNISSIDRIFAIHKADDTELDLELKVDTGLRSTSFTLDLSTAMSSGVIHKVVDTPLNGNVFRLRFSNNAASKPWEIQGFGVMWRNEGLNQPTP